MEILLVPVSERISVRVLLALDGVSLSVCLVFVHGDTLIPAVLDGLRAFWRGLSHW